MGRRAHRARVPHLERLGAEQHVYFYAEFSEPIRSCRFFDRGRSVEGIRELRGNGCPGRAEFRWPGRTTARGACRDFSGQHGRGRENLSAEIKGWNFDRVRSSAYSAWNEQLSAVRIEGGEPSRREVFYTSLYYAMLYPMLYSDVTESIGAPTRKCTGATSAISQAC